MTEIESQIIVAMVPIQCNQGYADKQCLCCENHCYTLQQTRFRDACIVILRCLLFEAGFAFDGLVEWRQWWRVLKIYLYCHQGYLLPSDFALAWFLIQWRVQ